MTKEPLLLSTPLRPSSDHRCEICYGVRKLLVPLLVSCQFCDQCNTHTYGYPFDQYEPMKRMPEKALFHSMVIWYQYATKRKELQ